MKSLGEKIVIFEILIVFGFYALVSIGHQGDGVICRIVQILGHVICILFFLLASFIPYFSLWQEQFASPEPPKHHSGSFLCDFGVRQLGNVQRYTLQCTYSFENTVQINDSDQGINAYLTVNGIVCGAVVILSLGSLVSVFTLKKGEVM